MHSDCTIVVRVEHLEGISEVEVRLHGELSLLSFDVILVTDQVSQTVNELVLVTTREHGLAGGARVPGRLGGGPNGRRAPVRGGWAQGRRCTHGRRVSAGRGGTHGR